MSIEYAVSIVIPTLNHQNIAVVDAVHQSVFPVDASRPTAGEIVFEGFGFADAGERRRLDGFKKRANARDDGGIGFLPECQVAGGTFRESDFQRSTSTVLPEAASFRLCARAARLLAVEVR